MNRTSLLVLAASGVLASFPASASDTDLKSLREEIAQMKQAYEQRIAALENRLAQAETKVGSAEDSARPGAASGWANPSLVSPPTSIRPCVAS